MSEQILIAPSILSADFTQLGEEIRRCEEAGADWFHIDIIDGHFAPNLTMGPFIVEACRRATDLPLDVHLMITDPDRYLEVFANAGASNLTVHIEASQDMAATQDKIQKLGCKVGITLNPATPAVELAPYLKNADLVLVMTVHPGFSGQKFMPEVVPKIGQIRQMLDEHNPTGLIEVDGGIDSGTIAETYQGGARVFVAASAIFQHPRGISSGISDLRAALD